LLIVSEELVLISEEIGLISEEIDLVSEEIVWISEEIVLNLISEETVLTPKRLTTYQMRISFHVDSRMVRK
jgi:hypothetical protein